jgi:hypothetical protein
MPDTQALESTKKSPKQKRAQHTVDTILDATSDSGGGRQRAADHESPGAQGRLFDRHDLPEDAILRLVMGFVRAAPPR